MTVVKFFAGLLSHRFATAFIFFLSAGARLLQVLYYYNPRVDASYQLMAAKNLLAGNGISLDTVSANDLSQIIYTPLINWPPGYSFLVSPFMFLFNNYMVGAMVLDAIMAMVLLLVSRKILKALDLPLYLVNAGMLFMGFYIYFFYLVASSDAVAIPFFLVAVLLFLRMMKMGEASSTNMALATFSLFVFASVKYLFMPVALILPGMMMVTGWKQHNKSFLRKGMISLFILMAAISFILVYQKLISGSAVYISQPERDFFPEHLLEAYPFIPASFLKPETIVEALPAGKNFFHKFYLGFHLVAFVILTALFVKQLRSLAGERISLVRVFYFITWSVALCLTILLAFLSIRVAKEEILPGWFWTYIEEPRYYGLAIVLLQLSALAYAFHSILIIKRRKIWLVLLLFLLFIPEIVRGLYFTVNRLSKFNKEEYSWQFEDRFQKYADAIIKNKIEAGKPVIVTGSSYYMNHRVNLYSKLPLLDQPATINNMSGIHTSRSVVLLVILQDKELAAYQPFIVSAKNNSVGSFQDYHFYIVHVSPR